jgi:hypothetical protein
MIWNAVTALAQWAEASGIHCCVAGLIPAVTPKYCTYRKRKNTLGSVYAEYTIMHNK